MTKIIGLHGQHVPETQEPVESVVEALEEMLADAKAGTLIGLACAYVANNHRAGYRLCGYLSGYSAIGAAQIVVTELVAAAMEDGE